MDSVRVPEGVAKVAMTPDEKVVNAAMFRIAREDHTLGNMLRMELLRDPMVKFVGYKHPHPLDNDIIIRVQSTVTVTPVTSLARSAARLEDELRHTQRMFSAACDQIRRESEAL